MTTRTIAIERYVVQSGGMITPCTLRPRPEAAAETAGRFSVDGASPPPLVPEVATSQTIDDTRVYYAVEASNLGRDGGNALVDVPRPR